MGMIGAIIGIMMSIVFHNSPFVLAFAPVGVIVGAAIGTLIDKRKKTKNDETSQND